MPYPPKCTIRRLKVKNPQNELKTEMYADVLIQSYALQWVSEVAEIATIGGAIKQYQVTVDPNQLQAYKLRA